MYGELSKEKLDVEFVRLDDRKFEEKQVSVDNLLSKEDLIEKILNLKLDSMTMYKIILTGKRNFEINARSLLEAVSSDNILKLKDNTKLNYDIEEIAKQNNIKGIFVREVLELYKDKLCTEEEFQKAIEIGLEAM